MAQKPFEKKEHTIPVRVKPSVIDDIKIVREMYAKMIIEKGVDRDMINHIMKKGLSYGETVEVVVKHCKGCKHL